MPYTLKFSDPAKIDVITVPDMPPGINTVDTSLSLVGRGYPNYGQKIADNFLHLLENFASASPPENPIEGQLWYDTSDPHNKVLRIMDGTSTATRWPSANGIYQQGTDPRNSSDLASGGLKIGDIWVDIADNQLKIFNSTDWTTVGPSVGGTQKTGAEVSSIEDTTGDFHSVIKNWANAQVVSIVADSTFTPKIVVEGFSKIVPGVNLSKKIFSIGETIPVFNGTAVAAKNLMDESNAVFSTNKFLRKDDLSTPGPNQGQVISGRVLFQTFDDSSTNEVSRRGRDGIVIINNTNVSSQEYVQFYKAVSDGILLNNTAGGKLIFKTKDINAISAVTVAEVGNSQILVNVPTTLTKGLSVANTLTVLSTDSSAVSVNGGIIVAKDIAISGNLLTAGTVSTIGTSTFGINAGSGSIIMPVTTGTYDIGSVNKYFRRLYVSTIGTATNTTILYGSVKGTATSLEQSTIFQLQGQVSAPSFNYNGTSTTATFNTTLSTSAISAQTTATVASSTSTLLILQNNSLNNITKSNFLSDVFPTGMITAYGTSTVIPPGWLLCNGITTSTTGQYSSLFSVIGWGYSTSTIVGGSLFQIPSILTTATGNHTVYYIIKT